MVNQSKVAILFKYTLRRINKPSSKFLNFKKTAKCEIYLGLIVAKKSEQTIVSHGIRIFNTTQHKTVCFGDSNDPTFQTKTSGAMIIMLTTMVRWV